MYHVHSKHALQQISPRRICSMYLIIILISKKSNCTWLVCRHGQYRIELVSRGCDRVISVEKDPAHHSFICKIMKEVQTDKCLPIRGDVFKFINSGREQFDFIFADPPYALKELESIPELIFKNNLLKEGVCLYWSMVSKITLKIIRIHRKKSLWKCEFLAFQIK